MVSRRVPDPHAKLTLTGDAGKLFCMGFLTLFLELSLIRYLAGNVWNLGYFPNLVLIATFVGMGLGFVLHEHAGARASTVLMHLAVVLLLGLVLFVHFFHPSVPGFDHWGGDIGGDLYFTAVPEESIRQTVLPFVVCLTGVATVFACLSQRTAKLFRKHPPLVAYTLDIGGSCTGILCFMLVSWLGIPAWVWFGVFALVLLVPLTGTWRTRLLSLLPALALVLLVKHQDSVLLGRPNYPGTPESLWTPYQRIQFMEVGLNIYANGVAHQHISPRERLLGEFYQPVHDQRRADGMPPYKNVLVLGAGSGNDVASALLNGAEHVDAVEIDPGIADLGRRHNPNHPYDDPRVKLVIDDGRAFMNRTERRYDLIVFALTDSLVKVSSMSQLRLENYLFTVDSVQKAGTLLAPQGDVVFYNFYRRPWLLEKLEAMVSTATGLEPKVIYRLYDFSVLRGRKGEPARTTARLAGIDLPTDDWPFLYLKERGVPVAYRWGIGAMVAFIALVAGLVRFSTRRARRHTVPGTLATNLAFLFMGLAFLLLETKSVIQFSLLFGTTWKNSSLVFLAVLLLVLAANFVAARARTVSLPLIGTLLVASCLFGYVFPLRHLLGIESTLLRFLAASLVTFTPVFFANLVFSVTFREQALPEQVFGWNLIGATLGGVVEYVGMRFGYAFLGVIVAAAYAVVLVLLARARALGQAAASSSG
jgi:predicted membrane-bound spermidine synthase